MVLRSKYPSIDLNKTELRYMYIASSWRWREVYFVVKSSTSYFGRKWRGMQLTYVMMLNKSFALNYTRRTWTRYMPWITHMRVFKCILYTMVPDKKNDILKLCFVSHI